MKTLTFFCKAEGTNAIKARKRNTFKQSTCSCHRCQTSNLKNIQEKQLLKSLQLLKRNIKIKKVPEFVSPWLFENSVRWVVFTLLECSNCLGNLLLNLPMNPKCGKARVCQLPSTKHLVLCILWGGFSFFRHDAKLFYFNYC